MPIIHLVKSVRIRSCSGPHFPRKNARKMRNRITPIKDSFYAVIVISKHPNAFRQQLLNKKQAIKEVYLGPYQTSKILCNY